MGRQFGHLLRRLPQGQQSSVDYRVQSLDPPVEDFGGAGDVGYLPDVQAALIGQRAVSAAGADQLIPGGSYTASKFDHAGFVINAD